MSNISNTERADAAGIRPAVVSLSNSGQRATMHVDRAVASRVAIIIDRAAGPSEWGLLQFRDELDRVLTASAQPASVSNRPVTYAGLERKV